MVAEVIPLNLSLKNAQNSLEYTDKIINDCGPRLTGTESCKKAAKIIHQDLSQYCDNAHIEKFSVHPRSFLGFINISVTSYIISSILLYFDLVHLASIGYFFSVFIMISQFILYWELFDPFYKKKTGYNVIGSIEPENEVKQQIIISGHHDSAYEFTFLAQTPRLYGIRILIALLILVITIGFSWYWGIFQIFTGVAPIYANVMKYAVFGGLIFVIPLYFFIKNRGTPGAGDNLIASSISLELSKIYGTYKKNDNNLLKNTRLIVISFDAEEAGLRGARAYVKSHEKELKKIPTFMVNIDSIYNVGDIKFLTTDINSTIKLSEEIVGDLTNISEHLGYKTSKFPMTPGGGGTDAAEFAKKGIKATTIIAMPTEIVRADIAYHTQNDTIDAIDPEAVLATFRITQKYIEQKDEEITKSN